MAGRDFDPNAHHNYTGGGGGDGGGYIHFNGDLRRTQTYGDVVTTTGGVSNVWLNPIGDLEKRVEELQSQVKELEESKAKLNQESDLLSTQRNLYNTLLTSGKLRDLSVGVNDILVVHVKIDDIPAVRVEEFLRSCKKHLAPTFEKVGLTGRVLFLAAEGTDHGFSVIRVAEQGMTKAHKEMVDYAKATAEWQPAKEKRRPPVMG